MKFNRIFLAALMFVVLSECISFGAAVEKSNNILGVIYSGDEKIVIYRQSPNKPEESRNKPASPEELVVKANNNDAEALHLLGMRYVDGNGVERDRDLGFSMVKKAADMGYVPAECDLGFLYYLGRGTSVDRGKAFDLFLKAAEKNYAVAQNNVGAMYQNGEYVQKNVTKAIHWYKKAAKQGSIPAQKNLGKIFELGEQGMQKNPSEAAKWYKMAAEQGDEEAKKALTRINSGPKNK